MQWTGLNELREKYLSFFEGKGHLRHNMLSLSQPTAQLPEQWEHSLTAY